MKRITSRFMMLIATAAVLPLVVYGAVSMGRLKQGTQTSVREGNLEVAEQVASQVKLYIDNNARILRSAGEELNATSLAPWQQTRILTNHVLEFPEFREISMLDASGRTARDQPPRRGARQAAAAARAVHATASTSPTCSSTTMRCRPPTCRVQTEERGATGGVAGRPAVARGAVAVRRSGARRREGLRARCSRPIGG